MECTFLFMVIKESSFLVLLFNMASNAEYVTMENQNEIQAKELKSVIMIDLDITKVVIIQNVH